MTRTPTNKRAPWVNSAWYEGKVTFERGSVSAWVILDRVSRELEQQGFSMKGVTISISSFNLSVHPNLLIRGRGRDKVIAIASKIIDFLPTLGLRHVP